jgi:hypothetical protein
VNSVLQVIPIVYNWIQWITEPTKCHDLHIQVILYMKDRSSFLGQKPDVYLSKLAGLDIHRGLQVRKSRQKSMLVLVSCACKLSQDHWCQKAFTFHCSWSLYYRWHIQTILSSETSHLACTFLFKGKNFQTFLKQLQLRFQCKHHKIQGLCFSGIWYWHWVTDAWCFKTM